MQTLDGLSGSWLYRHGLTAIAALFVIAQLVWFRPLELSVDWNGWRQADTQSIARNFFNYRDDVLHPRVRWGGDGPGFVESELALYPYLIGLGMRVVGPAPWIGQVLSALCMGLALLALAHQLRARFGHAAALAGSLAFVSPMAVVYLTTSVQPEALCLLLSVLALGAFLRWSEETAHLRWLVAYALLATLACLVKPTAMQILVAPAIVALFDGRLRRSLPQLAVAFLVVAAAGLLYVFHARGLYLAYGNTFGLLSGGDRKTPLLEHLVHPGLFLRAAVVFFSWGVGAAGTLALLGVVVRRRVDAWLVGFGIAAALWALFSLRYSVSFMFGTHYTVFGALLAAWAMALCVNDAAAWREGPRRALHAALAAALAAQLVFSHVQRFEAARASEPVQQVAKSLAQVAAPDTLVIVRSVAGAYDSFWRSTNNFEDPRLMYLSWTRGWILPSDAQEPAQLELWALRGARFFVDLAGERSPAIDAWLRTRGVRLTATEQGEIWQIKRPQN